MPPPASGPERRDEQSRLTRRIRPTKRRRANIYRRRTRVAGQRQDRAPRGRAADRSAPALVQATRYDASPAAPAATKTTRRLRGQAGTAFLLGTGQSALSTHDATKVVFDPNVMLFRELLDLHSRVLICTFF